MITKYRPDIDGLRAIAVTLVVLFHAKFQLFSGGYIGVDIFFVISGFLITSHLLSELRQTESINLTNFYAKRFKRLYPALVATIVLVSIIYYIFFSYFGQGITQLLKSATYSIVGLGNIFFLKKTGGYFDTSTDEMPFLHFWSLGVEEQFYFFWPIFILAFHKLFKKKISNKHFTVVIFTLCISSYGISEYWLQHDQMKAFYLMPSRVWELAIGGIIAVNYERLNILLNKHSTITLNILGPVSISGILCMACLYTNRTSFPGIHAIPVVLATALLIILGSQEKSLLTRIMSFRPLVHIGLLSYSWYLWHWPIFSILNIANMGQDLSLDIKLIAILGSLGLAYVSLHFIETPVRKEERFTQLSAKKTILVTGFISLFVILVAHLTINLNNQFFVKKYGNELVKLLQINSLSEMGCYKKNKICGHKEKSSDQIIYLWGDSHAASYLPVIQKFSEERRINSQSLVEVSQLPLATLQGFYNSTGDFHNYKEGAHEALKQIKEDKRVKSVILSARWNAYTGDEPISVADKPIYITPNKNKAKNLERYNQLLHYTLKELFKHDVQKILIILQFPEFQFSIQKCLHREYGCPISLQKNIEYRKNLASIFQSLAQKYPKKVQIFDPLEFYCNKSSCPQIVKVNNKYYPTTYDDDHPSAWSVLNMHQYMEPNLVWLASRGSNQLKITEQDNTHLKRLE